MLRFDPEEANWFEASWKISNKCNMNCSYCVRVLKKDDEEPKYLEIAEKINEMFDKYRPTYGCVYITGGEPYLWPIEEICDFKFNSLFMNTVRITSNMSANESRYLDTRRILNAKGIDFLLKGSFHQENLSLEKQKEFVEKCARAKCDWINIVVNDDNYEDRLALVKNYNFDGDKLIEVNGHQMKINWMVERLTGGGVASNVNKIPRNSRTFAIAEDGCDCSAGYSTIRIEPNGDVKRCFSTEVIGNVLESLPERKNHYNCKRKTCAGCINVWIYDKENINFFHNKKRQMMEYKTDNGTDFE